MRLNGSKWFLNGINKLINGISRITDGLDQLVSRICRAARVDSRGAIGVSMEVDLHIAIRIVVFFSLNRFVLILLCYCLITPKCRREQVPQADICTTSARSFATLQAILILNVEHVNHG